MNNLFRVTNLLVLPFWLLMLVAPKAKLTQRLMKNDVIFYVLASIYLSLLATGIVKNPKGMKEVMNPNLDGITKLLGDKQGAFTGWMHFLTFDLFVGRWMYLDSLEKGRPAPRLAMLTTFLAGPAGLLGYLSVSDRSKKK